MPLPEAAKDYLLKALSAQPVIAGSLLGYVRHDSPVWDRRPDPSRFTLREVLAHLADWEPIWLDRCQRFVDEDHPFLPSVDETDLVAVNDYATSNPSDSLRAYVEGRNNLVHYLKGIPDEAWDRTADRQFVGELTLHQQVAMALSHDGYHMKQIIEWLD
ncbi:MAG TPA: DinB family protein [Fimbriimonas sp.]|nr:DinB family protein [Fimbriimonas sp.]